MDNSTPLREEIDPDYEPTQEELLEYAEFLGLQLPQDSGLLYLVREGLKAPLPEPWEPYRTESGEIYYFNPVTGESDWVHPCDKLYQQKVAQLKARQRQAPRLRPHPPTGPQNFQRSSGTPQLTNFKAQLLDTDQAEREEIQRSMQIKVLAAEQQIAAATDAEMQAIQSLHQQLLAELQQSIRASSST